MDQWKSKESYDSFKLLYFKEYHSVDQQCKKLIEIEELVGEYENKHRALSE